MSITALKVGDLSVNCYLIAPEMSEASPTPAVVIDPGDQAELISAELWRRGLTLEMILLTHAHFDHIGGVAELLAAWPAAILACSGETSRRAGDPRLNLSLFMGGDVVSPPANRILQSGEVFRAAGMQWQAVEVAGHDPGEMVYVVNEVNAAFTGDTVFAGSIGRSDFPGGDARTLVKEVRKLLRDLPPTATLYPGHGPATTVAAELSANPFLT